MNTQAREQSLVFAHLAKEAPQRQAQAQVAANALDAPPLLLRTRRSRRRARRLPRRPLRHFLLIHLTRRPPRPPRAPRARRRRAVRLVRIIAVTFFVAPCARSVLASAPVLTGLDRRVAVGF